jgi:glycosyltransferase involved in cell wall biosynthesis
MLLFDSTGATFLVDSARGVKISPPGMSAAGPHPPFAAMIERVALDGLPLHVRSAGVGAYANGLIRALARRCPSTELVVFAPARPVLFLLRQASATSPSPPWPGNVRWATSSFYPLVMGYPIAGLPRAFALERALGSVPLFHGTNYALPRTRGAALVVTVHDLTLLRQPALGTAALRRLVGRVRRSVAEARRVIADSECTRRDLCALLDVPGEKICVVPLACDEHFRPQPRETARARIAERYGLRAPYLLHVGTLEPRKNLERLVRAYARLRRARRDAPLLALVGPPGWGDAAVHRAIDEAGAEEFVRLTGRVPADDLAALYAAAELFVFPSLYEGFGLPLLEAMACGLPAVASSAGALPELAGGAADLVDPRDETALCEAMLALLTDAARRKELRERGLRRAADFSWDRCARETLAVYAEALAED